MVTYSYITQGDALQQLSNRLYDSTEQFWSRTEKRFYLAEALRMWNAFTGYWRGDFTMQTVASTTFYDITNLTTAPNTLRAMTLTDVYIYNLLQYHLLEPSVGVNPWTGASTQYTANDLISGLTRRRDETLGYTGCTITRRTTAAVAGRTTLPDTVIDIRRIAYLPLASTGQKNSVMWPDDNWAEQSFNPQWTLNPPGTPLIYLQTAQPPISFDVDVPPAYFGNYEALTVEAGQAFSAVTPNPLLVPDDFAWVLRMGVLSDLFNKEGDAKDLLRATQCESMYKLGLAVLEASPAVVSARLANVSLQVDSIKASDLYNTGWQGATAAQPVEALTAGLNLIAFSPTPDAGPYSATLSVVENAPIPADDNAYVQVSRDVLDVLLDLCVHTAMIKVGGAEFMATMPLLERFLNQCKVQNRKLGEIGEFKTMMYGLSHREQEMNPVMQPESMNNG